MINKIYEKIKEIIIYNYKFMLGMLVLFLLLTFELPLTIKMPGGLIDVSNRTDFNSEMKLDGSLNMVYVLEIKATIPTYIISLFNKDWQVSKKEENITNEQSEKIGKLLLNESISNAIIAGASESNYEFTISNEEVYVYYILDDADTTLEAGNQIISIDGVLVKNKFHLSELINTYSTSDVIEINTDNGIKHAKLFSLNDLLYIGIGIIETKDVSTADNISFEFETSESGSSGGMMMSLSIYSSLSNKDITNGKIVAGTGTVDELGNVGPIGGLDLKVLAAMENDVDIFIAPVDNCDELEGIEIVDMTLYCVSTFDEALSYLNH